MQNKKRTRFCSSIKKSTYLTFDHWLGEREIEKLICWHYLCNFTAVSSKFGWDCNFMDDILQNLPIIPAFSLHVLVTRCREWPFSYPVSVHCCHCLSIHRSLSPHNSSSDQVVMSCDQLNSLVSVVEGGRRHLYKIVEVSIDFIFM